MTNSIPQLKEIGRMHKGTAELWTGFKMTEVLSASCPVLQMQNTSCKGTYVVFMNVGLNLGPLLPTLLVSFCRRTNV